MGRGYTVTVVALGLSAQSPEHRTSAYLQKNPYIQFRNLRVFRSFRSPEWSDLVSGLPTCEYKAKQNSVTSCFVALLWVRHSFACNRIPLISEQSQTTCGGLFWWPGITGKWKTSVTWSPGKQKLLCNSAQPELQRAEFKRSEACKLWNGMETGKTEYLATIYIVILEPMLQLTCGLLFSSKRQANLRNVMSYFEGPVLGSLAKNWW